MDVAVPAQLGAEIFVAMAEHPHWPGHSVEDWSAADYRRPWIGPWPQPVPALVVDRETGALLREGSPRVPPPGSSCMLRPRRCGSGR